MIIEKKIWDRSSVQKEKTNTMHPINHFMYNEDGLLICENDYYKFFSNKEYEKRVVYIMRIATFCLNYQSEPIPESIKNIYEIHLSEEFMKERYRSYFKGLYNNNYGVGFTPNTEIEYILYYRTMPINIDDLIPDIDTKCNDKFKIINVLDYKSNKIINGYRTLTELVDYPKTPTVFPYDQANKEIQFGSELPPVRGIYGK